MAKILSVYIVKENGAPLSNVLVPVHMWLVCVCACACVRACLEPSYGNVVQFLFHS